MQPVSIASEPIKSLGQAMIAAEDSFLPARQVRERYRVSDMSLWRWSRSPKVGFPQPIRINGFRYWRLADLVAFEQRQGRVATS